VNREQQAAENEAATARRAGFDGKTRTGSGLGAAESSLSGLQRTLGNQGMLQLLESGGLQAKLRVSQPGDADEQEADRAAEHVVSSQPTPRLQRKCNCGGSCSQCQEEEVIHRSARTAPVLGSFPFSIQRQAATTTTEGTSHRAPAAEAGARADQAKHPGERPWTLVVEDDAPTLGPGQMRKREFVSLLQTTTCSTADAVLEAVKHTTKGCPYIKKWLDHYKGQDAQHLMRAMHKYAPETQRARSAHEAIALVNQRVERAALSWAKTGKVTDLPEGIQEEMAGGGGGFLGKVMGFAQSGFGSGLLGFIGGGKKEEKGKGKASGDGAQRKSRDGAAAGEHDAAAVKEQLGSGQSLDGGVASRMSAAFGYDFSGVRVHTDAKAGELSGQLNARAFTIGRDVAFAGGEYKPGTLIGDALIAHELAHVVQQGGGNAGPQTKDASLGDDSNLERDADRSAVGAVVAAWTGAKKGLAEISVNAMPRLKSSLKLQKFSNCNCHKQAPESEAIKQKVQADPPGFQQAVEAHRAQQRHVRELLEGARAVPRGEASPPFAVLQNSIEWIEKKKFKLKILTPTHDATSRKKKQVAYFDDRVDYPTIDGTYDPTGASDTGVVYREENLLGEAPPVPPSARSSMRFTTIPLFLSQEPVPMEELSGSIMHETQHMADRIEPVPRPITGVNEVERLYQTEFHSYWVQRPLEELEPFPGGHYVPKSASERGRVEVPGFASNKPGQDFGSDQAAATNLTVEGSNVKEKGDCKRVFPDCNPEGKKQTTKFRNQKQQKIFEQLINNYGSDLFDCSYVCSGAFKTMVDRMTGPIGVNLVNSLRIDALLDDVDACDPKMDVTNPRLDRIVAEVENLDDLEKEFLRGGLASFPQELKEEAVRRAQEEKERKKLDLSSLTGAAARSGPEKHEAPVSFWLYLSRKLPDVVLKKIQQNIRASRPAGKKP
jgi:hypothetical protein